MVGNMKKLLSHTLASVFAFTMLLLSQQVFAQIPVDNTKWRVAGIEDAHSQFIYHPTPWHFQANNTVEAAGYWHSTWKKLSGPRVQMADGTEVIFVSPRVFVALLNGKPTRLGQLLSGEAGAPEAFKASSLPVQNTCWRVAGIENSDENEPFVYHPWAWHFEANGKVGAGPEWTYPSIPNEYKIPSGSGTRSWETTWKRNDAGLIINSAQGQGWVLWEEQLFFLNENVFVTLQDGEPYRLGQRTTCIATATPPPPHSGTPGGGSSCNQEICAAGEICLSCGISVSCQPQGSTCCQPESAGVSVLICSSMQKCGQCGDTIVSPCCK